MTQTNMIEWNHGSVGLAPDAVSTSSAPPLDPTQLLFKKLNTEKLVERLPEKYRSGWVLMEDGDLSYYLNVFLLSFSGFCLLYILLNILFKRCDYFFSKEDLATKSEDDKFWRVQGWVLITHHTLAVTLSVRSLYSSCITGDSDEESRWQWIRSDECFAMISPSFVTIVIISLGFLTFDYILMRMSLQN